MKNIKFEYIFAFCVFLALCGAMVLFRENAEVVNGIIAVLIGTLSAITAYFFTKHNPNK